MKPKFHIILMLLTVTLALNSCSSDTFNTKKYMNGSGFDDPKEWFSNFKDDSVTYVYYDYIASRNSSMAINYPAEGVFKFREPVAILFTSQKKGRYAQPIKSRFIRLPGITAANSLAEAKTLIAIEYREISKLYYIFKIDVYDIRTHFHLASYGGSVDNIELPGINKILNQAYAVLNRAKYVGEEDDDNMAIWDKYIEHIKNLGYDDPSSKLYKVLMNPKPTISAIYCDSAKLASFTRDDIKARMSCKIGSTPTLRLQEYSRSIPQKEDWLIIAVTEYDSQKMGAWYMVWKKTGLPTGEDGVDVNHFYNVYFINGKDGSILTSYTVRSQMFPKIDLPESSD